MWNVESEVWRFFFVCCFATKRLWLIVAVIILGLFLIVFNIIDINTYESQ